MNDKEILQALRDMQNIRWIQEQVMSPNWFPNSHEIELVKWELSQEFIFEANADEVVTFFMGSNEWQSDKMSTRVLEIKDGDFILRVWLAAGPGVRALYSIGITGGTRAGIEFYDEKAKPLLSASTDLGEIALHQNKAGECKASLYLESNPRRLGSDNTSLWHVTPRLLGVLWSKLISEWLQRPQDKKLNAGDSGKSTAEDKAIKQPLEHPDRAAKKDKVAALWKGGRNLTEISTITDIPYSTVKVYRDELIDEGKLPREAKKVKRKPNPDSI